MIGSFFHQQLDYIFFFYGLSFIILSGIVASFKEETRASKPAWGWLSAFGLLHGINEWLDMLAVDLFESMEFKTLRFVIMTISFFALCEFARSTASRMRYRVPGIWIYAILAGLIALGGIFGLPGLSAVSRYVSGFVGAISTAFILFIVSRREEGSIRRNSLTGVALVFLVYAFVTGVVVGKAAFFPASIINQQFFEHLFHFPVQLIRAMCAVTAAVCIWDYFNGPPIAQKGDVTYANAGRRFTIAIAGILAAIIIAGWFLTVGLGEFAHRTVIKTSGEAAEILSDHFNDTTLIIDHAVSHMSQAQEIARALMTPLPETIVDASKVVDSYALQFGYDVCYVLDMKGTTVVSSDRAKPNTLLGNNYSFRPYFINAVKSVSASYMALGVTSGKRGYYSSRLIRSPSGVPVGVAVIKKDIDEVEHAFAIFPCSFLIDPNGIIFMSTLSDMVFKSLWPIDAVTHKEIVASKQFGPGPFQPILNLEIRGGEEVLFQGNDYQAVRLNLNDDGWSIVLLGSLKVMKGYRLFGILITLIICVLIIIFYSVAGQREALSRIVLLKNDELVAEIRARKNTENVLQVTQFTVDHAADAILWAYLDRTIAYVNVAACSLAGYPREELLGREIKTLFSKPSGDAWTAIWSDMKTKGARSFEAKHKTRDGQLISVDISSGYIKFADREYAVFFVRDVRSRKKAEMAVMRARDFYLKLLEDFPALIWRSGRDARYDYFNKTWLAFTGRTMEEEMGDGWIRGIHPDDLERRTDTYVGAFYTRKSFSIEYRLRRHDGSYRWIVDAGRPYSDLDGTFIGYIGSCYDITERKQAEEEIRHLASFPQLNPNPIIEISDGGAVTFNNDAVFSVLESLNLPMDPSLFLPEDFTKIIGEMKAAHSEQTSIEKRLKEKDFILSITFVEELQSYRIYATDITERKLSEERLKEAYGDLKETKDALVASEKLASLGRFSSGIAHEIRNPLAIIMSATEYLQAASPAEDEQTKDILSKIKDACIRASTIIKGLLQFGRVTDLKKENVGLAAILEDTIAMIAYQMKLKNIELRRAFNLSGVAIEADPQQLQQVFFNIFINAMEAMPAGGLITVDIKPAALSSDFGKSIPAVAVVIRDAGIGIAPDHMAMLFEPFATTKRDAKNVGLGLAVSRDIVEKHKGSIAIQSEEGKWTEVTVTLPILHQSA